MNLSRRSWALYLIYSGLLCAAFAFAGFPLPHVDDPSYVGTAEHLAKTGQLDNPYMRNCLVAFTPDKYFGQFPAYTYLLAGWMKVAGMGLSSVLTFYMAVNFLNCLFAAWFFQRAKLSGTLCIFFPWILLSFSQTQGFRPDVTGLCAFWISLVCLTYSTIPLLFVAALFGSMAVLLWPVILGFVCPVFAVRLILLWNAFPLAQRFSKILRVCIAITIGIAISFLSFLFMIGFEWNAFIHDFLLVTSMRRPAGSSILYALLGLSWSHYNHFFLISVLILSGFFIYWPLRSEPVLSQATRIWILESFLGFVLATILYAVNTQLIYFFFWIAAIAVAADFFAKKAWAEFFAIAFLSIGLCFQVWSDAKRLIPPRREDISGFAADLKRNPAKVVVFDEISYRYLFDLQPPPGSLMWICLRPAPAVGAPVSEKTSDQIWIISNKWLIFPSENGTDKLVFIR